MKRQNSIYYTGNFRNNSSKPAQIRIVNTFTQPLLEDPAEFQGRVDEFTIDNTNLPTMVAVPKQDGATDVDELNCYIGLKWNGNVTIVWLRLTSVNEWDRPPKASPTADLNHQPYYSIVSIQHWLDICNTALQTAYANLVAFPGYPFPGETNPPFLTMSAESGILSLVFPQTMTYDEIVNPHIASFIFSRSLQNILKLPYNNILYDTTYEPTPNVAYETGLGPVTSNGQTQYLLWVRTSVDYLSTVNYTAQFESTQLWTAPAYYFCTAFDWRGQWCGVKKIILECNLARTEQATNTRGTIQDELEPVLASYTIDLDGPQSVNGLTHYTPFYPKIWDIGKQSQVNTIMLNFFWKNEDGRKYPLLATFGSETSIKIAFERMDKVTDSSKKKK